VDLTLNVSSIVAGGIDENEIGLKPPGGNSEQDGRRVPPG
jgi:hypothetical protein